MNPGPAPGDAHWRTLSWDELESALDGLALAGLPAPEQLRFDAQRGSFLDDDQIIELRPPLVLPTPPEAQDAETWLEELPNWLGTHLVILLRAGAYAIGLWEQGELLRHKCEKKYVTRGRGRAQPTHLETRGKSRYGSRLRLQNARSLLSEVRQRIQDWLRELDASRGQAPDAIFLGSPERMRARLLESPIEGLAPEQLRTLPGDFEEPGFEELGRCYRRLCQGQLRVAED
jgi:hypothetical protein